MPARTIRPILASGPAPRGRARVHSRLVRLLRWLLPTIMVGVIGLLVGLIVLHSVRRQIASHRGAAAPVEMVNPRFFGRDNQGRPYVLGARQASRDEQSSQRVLLGFPWVILDTSGPQPSKVTADAGVYQEDTRMLYLKGHVRAERASTTRFAADEAIVNTRTGTVSSPTAVAGESDAGSLQSNSFNAFNKGETMVFKGGVHARLNQR